MLWLSELSVSVQPTQDFRLHGTSAAPGLLRARRPAVLGSSRVPERRVGGKSPDARVGLGPTAATSLWAWQNRTSPVPAPRSCASSGGLGDTRTCGVWPRTP